jgi:3-isopropylmalate/(R)-2-methylmalate dehydratase large subunit
VGAFTGLIQPDQKTVEFLVRERGMDRREAEGHLDGLFSDPDAEYEEVITIDADALKPMVALPGDPGNGLFISELGKQVKVDIAYAGSCTAGKKEDMDMYARVLKEAADAGQHIHPDVKFYIQFGSQDVKRYAEGKGYLDIFRKVGAEIIEPSCGACINAGPGVSYDRETVTVSAINRNFPGRSGPGQLYLASPYTTAASALAGYITAWEPGSMASGPRAQAR